MHKRIYQKHQALRRRHARVRAGISGTKARPRLAVFRSLKYISAQLIDDRTGRTLASATDRELKTKTGTKTERATSVGELLAQKAKDQKITHVVFDRGGYRYHGRVQAVADGARQGGLQF